MLIFSQQERFDRSDIFKKKPQYFATFMLFRKNYYPANADY